MSDLKSLVRTIPDYPKKGIMFRDITTLLQDAEGLERAVRDLAKPYITSRITKIAGIEARGFILGGAMAVELGAGFVPIRKKGKLPFEVVGHDYELEYGSDRVEMHVDAIKPGERVLVVDDLIATGGTAEAACRLVEGVGGTVVATCFLVDLPDLGGRKRLEALGHKVEALMAFAGE